MTSRNKHRLFVSVGFAAILLATRFGSWPVYLRGLLVLVGGWLMAMGMVYQVTLFAQQKGVLYYTLLVFAGVFGLSMLVLTLFWLVSLH